MNIFVTSTCPIESAKNLDNKRVGKMIIESVQMLSTALILNGQDAPYKISHVNHPCNIWVRSSLSNYIWLYVHAYALGMEFERRYGKVHKSFQMLKTMPTFPDIEDVGQTPFVNCAANLGLGISFKHIQDVPTAYKLYLDARNKG